MGPLQGVAPAGSFEEQFALGLARERDGALEEADRHYREAVRLAPGRAEGHTNLGVLLAKQGRISEAIGYLRRATEIDPRLPEAHNSLGAALLLAFDVAGAIPAFARAVDLRPAFTIAAVNLTGALCRMRRFDAAIEAARKALSVQPGNHELHGSLGFALAGAGRLADARNCYEAAIRLAPRLAGAYSGLGHVLTLEGRFRAAVTQFKIAIALQPDFADAHYNLGVASASAGLIDEAIAAYRRALAIKPAAAVHSNLLFSLNGHPGLTGPALLAEHQRWAERDAAPLTAAAPPCANNRDPERRLRIGYVSPDFHFHSIAFFLKAVLASHDRKGFEVICYSDAVQPDSITSEFMSSADLWRNTADLPDEQLAALIRKDAVDILVDLTVHSRGNRLLVFARKPAPVQVTYLGYPGTTGLSAIDYKITDDLLDPPGLAESQHTEKMARLAGCYFSYQPAGLDLPPGPLPAASSGKVTFAVFQALPKINSMAMQLWARILAEVPGSRLWLKALGLGEEETRQDMLDLFARSGIGGERLRFDTWSDFDGYVAALQNVDIALDTYPFNGATTTFHTLWMGVPVVSLAGPTPVSRMGLSILSRLGLADLVADTPDNYISLAARLAADLPRLSALRTELRGRMLAAGLTDAGRHARDLESLLRNLWRKRCEDASR